MWGVMPAHLVRRGGIYYFRRAVPRHLVVRFGRAELKYSLQTRDIIHAQIRCQTYSNRFDTLVATVEQVPALRMQNIESLIRTYFAGLLSEAEEIVFLMRGEGSRKMSANDPKRTSAPQSKCWRYRGPLGSGFTLFGLSVHRTRFFEA